MKKLITTILILCPLIAAYCQTKGTDSKFNFDFERIENENPAG
jgi:hypothetical protein